MKKLTAGIFTGILTIISVSAADAAITSKAYVDGKFATQESLATTNANVTKNTGDIASLTTTVQGNTTNITTLQETVEGLAGEGTGSVADQIADALGNGIGGEGQPADVSAALALKADKTALATTDGSVTKNTEAIEALGATVAANKTAADGVATRVTTAEGEIDALQAATTGLSAEKVNQITTNQTAIETITQAGTGTIDTRIKAATDAINTDLEGKQDTLNATNVTTNGTGNAITSITAADGVVTATKTAVIPEVTTRGETGTFVLTATVSDSGVTNYMWESIERASGAAAASAE